MSDTGTSAFKLNPEQMDTTVDAFKGLVPDGGELVGGLRKGPIGFAGAVASIIEGDATEQLAEDDRNMDKLAEQLAEPLGAGVEEYNKHVQDGKQAIADIQSALAPADSDPDPIGTRFQMIQAFADASLEAAKDEIEAHGRREEVTLLNQNATPQQIAAAKLRTRAKIKLLDERKSFFDGSGLMLLEQAARRKAQPQLKADDETATAAKSKAMAANQDLRTEIQHLQNQLGKGEHGEHDPVYVVDQNRIAEAQHLLDDAKEAKRRSIAYLPRANYMPDDWQQMIDAFDQEITEIQEALQQAQHTVQSKQDRLSLLQGQVDDSTQRQADATALAENKNDEAAKNQRRIDELPRKIVVARLKELMQQASDAKVAAYDAETDKQLQAPPTANPEQAGLNITPDFNQASRNIPINFPSGAGAAGGRRVDPDRLNDILSGLILEQDALKKSLAESQKKQARMEQEIEELQRGQDLHTRQIRSANSNRF